MQTFRKRLGSMPRERPTQRCGVVLIVVLVLVVLVALAGFGFVSTMSTEDSAARLHGDQLQAAQTLQSAELLVRMMLNEDLQVSREDVLQPDAPQLFRGVPLDAGSLMADADQGLTEAEAVDWQWTIIAPGLSPAMESEWNLRYGLQDESAKLSLHAIVEWDYLEPDSGREALMTLPAMTPEIADCILDWIDADDDPREFGAERDFYQQLTPPYVPRNALPETLDELLFVRGMRPELLSGFDADRNFVLDPAERQRFELSGIAIDSSEPFPPQGWGQLLSIRSAERNVNANRQPRIDLNSSDLQALHQRLSGAFSRELANFVILWRQYGPAPQSIPPTNSPIPEPIFSRAAAYPIASVASLFGSQVLAEVGSSQVMIRSPLRISNQDVRDYLPKLLDLTTTLSEEIVYGRMNINQAPRSVLMALPGVGASEAEQIISLRDSLSADSLASPAWPIIEGVIALEAADEFCQWVTIGGDVYRAQIIAFRDESGPFERAEILLDSTLQPAGRIQYESLTHLGIGFPQALLSRSDTGNLMSDSPGF